MAMQADRWISNLQMEMDVLEAIPEEGAGICHTADVAGKLLEKLTPSSIWRTV